MNTICTYDEIAGVNTPILSENMNSAFHGRNVDHLFIHMDMGCVLKGDTEGVQEAVSAEEGHWIPESAVDACYYRGFTSR
jgi:hypothetical protein